MISRTAPFALATLLVSLVGCAPPPPEVPDPIAQGMEVPVARAIATARDTVKASPHDEAAWRVYANLLDAHDLNEEAVVAYRAVLGLNAGDLDSRYNLGIVLEYTGRAAESLSELERVRAERPQDLAVSYRIAELQSREGRYAEAATALRHCLTINPQSQICRRALAVALLGLGETDEALPILEKLITEVPQDRGTASALAQAWGRVGQGDKAKSLQENLPESDALALADPVRHRVVLQALDAQSCLRRSQDFERKGDFQSAIRELERAIEANPNQARFYDRLGRNYIRLRQPKNALPYFDQSVAVDPGHVNGYFNRGAAYEALGNRKAAVADYRRVLKLKPDHELATRRLRELGEL